VSRARRLCVAAAIGLSLTVSSGWGAGAGADEHAALDLFQRIARADLVVHVRIRDGTLRFAVVDVLGEIKGRSPGGRLRIAFRDYNFNRRPGREPIVFPNGEEDVLLLVPDREVRNKPKNRDIFELYLGPEGRFVVPAEGAGPLLETLSTLAEISQREPAGQVAALADLLTRSNIGLVEASLEEIARLRAETPALADRLIALLGRPSPRLRCRSLDSIASLFKRLASGSEDDWPPEEIGVVLAAVTERARNDPDETVRVEAVSALAVWPKRADVEADLRAISEQDPAQSVRYAALKALFKAGA
jgi:hypothetical protein